MSDKKLKNMSYKVLVKEQTTSKSLEPVNYNDNADDRQTMSGREQTRASATGRSDRAATERTSSESSVRLCIITGNMLSSSDIARSW